MDSNSKFNDFQNTVWEENPNSKTSQEIQAHIYGVRLNIADFCEDLQKRAAVHDDSKLSGEELSIYEAVDATPREAFGTPAYYERLTRLKPALDHHYVANDHHPEHYENGVAGMSLAALVEMFCDWRASSHDMEKSVNHCCDRFNIPPMLRQIFLNSI